MRRGLEKATNWDVVLFVEFFQFFCVYPKEQEHHVMVNESSRGSADANMSCPPRSLGLQLCCPKASKPQESRPEWVGFRDG